MNTPVPAPETKEPPEKILVEFQPMLIPTILNLENLVIIGFVAISVIAATIFRLGLAEILVIVALFLLLAVPSLKTIFETGSTNYVLTNRRVVIFSVGFGPRERSIPLDQILEVRCRQSGLQRFTGAGEVAIKQKGLRKPVRLVGLKDCKRRGEQILQAARKYKNA